MLLFISHYQKLGICLSDIRFCQPGILRLMKDLIWSWSSAMNHGDCEIPRTLEISPHSYLNRGRVVAWCLAVTRVSELLVCVTVTQCAALPTRTRPPGLWSDCLGNRNLQFWKAVNLKATDCSHGWTFTPAPLWENKMETWRRNREMAVILQPCGGGLLQLILSVHSIGE